MLPVETVEIVIQHVTHVAEVLLTTARAVLETNVYPSRPQQILLDHVYAWKDFLELTVPQLGVHPSVQHVNKVTIVSVLHVITQLS
jgi:hypothetical protein